MTSQTDSITVAARDLDIADMINGARVSRVDATTAAGAVYVWIDGNANPCADMIFNHGDPVRIVRPVLARQAVVTIERGDVSPLRWATYGDMSDAEIAEHAGYDPERDDFDDEVDTPADYEGDRYCGGVTS